MELYHLPARRHNRLAPSDPARRLPPRLAMHLARACAYEAAIRADEDRARARRNAEKRVEIGARYLDSSHRSARWFRRAFPSAVLDGIKSR